MKPRLSKSSLEAYARCPRLYKYQYIDNKTTAFPNDILTFGTEFHNGLEMFWKGEGLYQVDSSLFQDPDQAIICQELILSYHSKYDLDGVTLILAEEKFEYDTELSTRVAIFDAVIEYQGRTLLVESKTTRSYLNPDSYYWNRLDLDLQTGYYVWFAKEQGHPIDGVLYDVSRVPKLARGKVGRKKYDNESYDEFAARVRETLEDSRDDYHVRRLHQPNVDEVMQQVEQWEDIIADSHKYNTFPKNHTSCYMYGRRCEFHPVCTGQSSLDNERLYTIRKKESNEPT